MHLLLLKIVDCTLDSILSLAEVLVLADGSEEIEGEVCVDDMVDSISKGFLSVKKVELVQGNSRTDIVR